MRLSNFKLNPDLILLSGFLVLATVHLNKAILEFYTGKLFIVFGEAYYSVTVLIFIFIYFQYSSKINFLIFLLFGFLILAGITQLLNTNMLDDKNFFTYGRMIFINLLTVLAGGLIHKPKNILKLTNILFYVSLGAVTIGMVQFFFRPSFLMQFVMQMKEIDPEKTNILGAFRISGLTGSSVTYSLACAFIFYFAMITKSKIEQLFAVFGMLVSLSRISLVLMFSLGFLYLLMARLYRTLILNLALIIATVSASLYYLYTISPFGFHYVIDRLSKIFIPSDDKSFADGRIERWSTEVLPRIMEHPFGLGIGSTGTREHFDGYQITPFLTESIYLQFFVELGVLPGALILLSVIFATIILLTRIFSGRATVIALFTVHYFIAGIISPINSAMPFSCVAYLCLGSVFLKKFSK